MSDIEINIERLVLDGFGMPPSRAENIRGMIELELQRILIREGLADYPGETEISKISTPVLQSGEMKSDVTLAEGIANRIVLALRGKG